MPKFRKKPVIITALQWFPGVEIEGVITPDRDGVTQFEPYIDTLEGPHLVRSGDWIIVGIKGEKYPCKPDIFKATYEPADQEAIDAFREPLPASLKGETRIRYSRDRKHYYLPDYSGAQDFWLSTETYPGAVPEDKKSRALNGYLQINKDDGTTYYRVMYSFAFWEIKSGDEENIELKNDLAADYLAHLHSVRQER